MRPHAFPKPVRLRKRAEYLAVQRRGRKVQGEHLVLLLVPGDAARVGVTVSSKVGNAVLRNRLKRWTREYLRRHRQDWPMGDAVIVAKVSAADADHAAIDHDLSRLLARARGPGPLGGAQGGLR